MKQAQILKVVYKNNITKMIRTVAATMKQAQNH